MARLASYNPNGIIGMVLAVVIANVIRVFALCVEAFGAANFSFFL